MVEGHIYCGIQLVDVEKQYQVISTLALAVVVFTNNKPILNFLFFLYGSYSLYGEILCFTLVGEMAVSLEDI